MSAFMVGDEHIAMLIHAGLTMQPRSYGPMRWYYGNPLRNGELTHETADQVGAMLIAENQRSVNYRSGEDEIETIFAAYSTTRRGRAATVVEVLKGLACYEYQACETPDWRDTEAHAFCESLRKVAIARIPGWDEAPAWEWTAAGVQRHDDELRAKAQTRIDEIRERAAARA